MFELNVMTIRLKTATASDQLVQTPHQQLNHYIVLPLFFLAPGTIRQELNSVPERLKSFLAPAVETPYEVFCYTLLFNMRKYFTTLRFNSSRNPRQVWKEMYAPALELSERQLHPLDWGVHLLLDHHPVASQWGSTSLQVLHRAVNVGSWGVDIKHDEGTCWRRRSEDTFWPRLGFTCASETAHRTLSIIV